MREGVCKSAIMKLSNHELVEATRALNARSNELTAELIAHLAEVDSRKLYLEQAQPSMFSWCVTELGCSENVAYNLIGVARASRTYPLVLNVLREGKVHLTGLRMLVPHLTEEGHQALLREAAGKSKREIEELVARIAPRPAVPSSIRKLPVTRPLSEPPRDEGSCSVTSEGRDRQDVPASPVGVDAPSAQHVDDAPPVVESSSARTSNNGSAEGVTSEHPRKEGADMRPASSRRTAGTVEPLSPEAYRVTFTASRILRDKIRQAQDLLGHQVPAGDLAVVVERGLDLLIEEVKKKRFAVGRKARTVKSGRRKTKKVLDSAATTRPHTVGADSGSAGSRNGTGPNTTGMSTDQSRSRSEHESGSFVDSPEHRTAPAQHDLETGAAVPAQSGLLEEGGTGEVQSEPRDNRPSRYIPAEIRRAVFERDGGQCTFVDDRGGRCPARKRLEFDHAAGFARFGLHTVEGLRLRCRPHNQWSAARMYGLAFMDKKRSAAKRLAPGRVPESSG